MNIIDSSGWLEYFADGPNAPFFSPPLQNTAALIVPAITIYEVRIRRRSMGLNIFRKNLEGNKALKRKNHVAQGPPSGLRLFHRAWILVWGVAGSAGLPITAPAPAPDTRHLTPLPWACIADSFRGDLEPGGVVFSPRTGLVRLHEICPGLTPSKAKYNGLSQVFVCQEFDFHAREVSSRRARSSRSRRAGGMGD